MTMLIAGSGTYNNPFMLDFIEDSYVKSLVLINLDYFKEKLPIFFENFNSQLNKLSFYKMTTQVIRDLGNVVEWIELSNRVFFNHFNIKCVLYIVENQYQETENGTYKQKRRSFPLETLFFDAFPEMYEKLLTYVKARKISHKSEVKLALVFKKFTKRKQLKTEMRINTMMVNDAKKAYAYAVENQESILFDETDIDEGDKVTYTRSTNDDGTKRDSQNSASEAESVGTSAA